jgi:hypothetical protein
MVLHPKAEHSHTLKSGDSNSTYVDNILPVYHRRYTQEYSLIFHNNMNMERLHMHIIRTGKNRLLLQCILSFE